MSAPLADDVQTSPAQVCDCKDSEIFLIEQKKRVFFSILLCIFKKITNFAP